jgi:hypothetical protein
MNIQTIIPAEPESGNYEELVATASHNFEPWIRGLETPMTPANLHAAADESAFRAIFFAYEAHFKTKAELIALAQKDQGAEDLKLLLECFGGAIDWLDMLTDVLKGARARILCSAAAAALLEGVA